MNPPGSVEDLKKTTLCGSPKTRFIDFGLLYESDKGDVVFNDVRMADIHLASLVYVSTYCVFIALLRQNLLYFCHAQIIINKYPVII